ncbi:hypothetical protein UZ36_05460 [Candidatus Nitromaritima sp. SCGC AAA799-C22]|nr:hypothetical protein UZ36_05460 [Candidatus Nitromaritima sp. SCGC AAA799-C22]
MRRKIQIQLLLIVAFFWAIGTGVSLADESQPQKTEILQQYQLTVMGLECKKCIPDVQKPLLKIPGVRDAQVTQFDTAGSITHVEAVPGSISGEQLILALQAVGLQAEINSIGEPREVLLTQKSGFGFFDLFK